MAPTALDQQLSSWLKPLGQMRATNQGAYYVKGYQSLHCQGSIALLGLYRNAEAAHILPILVPNADSQGYIFNKQIHQSFPQFGYAFARVKQKIRQLLAQPKKPIHALAFAEFGQCQIAQLIAKTIH